MKWIAFLIGGIAYWTGQHYLAYFLLAMGSLYEIIDDHEKAKFRRDNPEFF